MRGKYNHPLKTAILTKFGSYELFTKETGVDRFTLRNIYSGHSGCWPATMQKMADALGVSYDTIRIWCRGERWQKYAEISDHPLAKAIRQRLYTITEFSEVSGLGKDTINNLIAKRSKGSRETFEKIAKALETEPYIVKAWCDGTLKECYEDFVLMPTEVVEPPKPKYEYEYVLDNIRLYGNSIVARKNKLNEVIDYLKANGIDPKVRTVPKSKNDGEYWVIEA